MSKAEDHTSKNELSNIKVTQKSRGHNAKSTIVTLQKKAADFEIIVIHRDSPTKPKNVFKYTDCTYSRHVQSILSGVNNNKSETLRSNSS